VDANSSRLLTSFWFEVSLIRSGAVVAGSQRSLADSSDAPAPPAHVVGDGAFQECSGLEIEMDVQEYQEGGRNNGVVRRVGRAKVAPIVLKRGMFYAGPADSRADDTLWAWMQSILNDVRPVPRYDGLIHVMSGDRTVRATWVFERGLPAKVKGPELNGKTGEIAIEELHIAHEGLHLLASARPVA
jgi:phage tail-like protein